MNPTSRQAYNSHHKIWVVSGYKCAFVEGFADYIGAVGHPWSINQFENGGRTSYPAKTEGNIAALLLDLIDDANEGSDKTTYGARYVMQVVATCRADGSQMRDVGDFVWCLENRVVRSVHQQHFPGLGVPSNVRESASEPSNWKLTDIRSTWIANVGRR